MIFHASNFKKPGYLVSHVLLGKVRYFDNFSGFGSMLSEWVNILLILNAQRCVFNGGNQTVTGILK